MRSIRSIFIAVLVIAFANLAWAEKPAYKTISAVTYIERDGRALKADVLVPTTAGRHPSVLVVHGGAWRGGNRFHLAKAATALAKAGYTVASIDYRLAPKDPFPAQIDDCKAAVRWMRTSAEKYQIDPERIGGFGYSAGGHLVSLLGTTDAKDGLVESGIAADAPSTRLQAIVAGGAPVDFQLLPADTAVLSYWLGGTRAEKPDLYRQASPLEFVTADDPPMFLFHGTRDAIVPSLNSLAMAAKLRAAKVHAEVHLVERKGHVATMFDDKCIERAVAFFDERLKPVQVKADAGAAR